MNELGLLTKDDIPFNAARITIHQPTCKQIGLIGEDAFLAGCQMLTFKKDRLIDENEQGKNDLEKATNFDILMTVVRDKNPQCQQNVINMKMVLALLFPDYMIQFLPRAITFIKDKQILEINAQTYDQFQQIIRKMFCLDKIFDSAGQHEYNPANALAKRIADRFRKRQEQLAKKRKKDGQKITIISRYISILAVGEHKDINALSQYSVYQLFNEFQRFNLKQASDIYIQAKMAGAQNVKEVKNWMSDLDNQDQTE